MVVPVVVASGAGSLALWGGRAALAARTSAKIVPRALQGAEFTARNGGRLMKSAAAGNTIGVGSTSALLKAMLAVDVADLSLDAADWVKDNIDDDDRDNCDNVQNDIIFGDLQHKHSPRKVKDTFSETYPYALAMNPTSESYDNSDNKNIAKRKIFSREIGFWGVYVEVKTYDPSSLSTWKHSLNRANFGSLALCKLDIPIMEASIHYAQQLILCPIVRMLTMESINSEPNKHVTNRVHGYLAPGVEAEISFLPVWEVQHWEWQKSKPP
ncbi:hypothetical protein BCD67_24705 [Oscillatoriales cyanobacterium USR001]|nr:hypothetical protein BCD67_24705 [Oscillatoriales cyanobacterium USR001]